MGSGIGSGSRCREGNKSGFVSESGSDGSIGINLKSGNDNGCIRLSGKW